MADQSSQIAPSRPARASSKMSEDIRSRILSGELRAGHRLPSERELGDQYGLGRTSVREALRSLATQGLIETTQGRTGGSTVKVPPPDSIDQSIELFMHGQQINVETVIETREFVEPIVATLAARHRTDQDLVDLGAAQARLESSFDDPDAFLLANVEWHLAVCRASHNPLLIAFMNAISRAIHKGTTPSEFNSDEIRQLTVHAHDRICKAIVARDEEAAGRRMRRHVVAYAREAVDAVSANRTPKLKRAQVAQRRRA